MMLILVRLKKGIHFHVTRMLVDCQSGSIDQTILLRDLYRHLSFAKNSKLFLRALALRNNAQDMTHS
jgi:hypothetical protein